MAYLIDETHDPARRSWVDSAQGHAEFPIQNLPFGIFSVGAEPPRGGIAIGESIFDLQAALAAGLFLGAARGAAEAAARPSLNDFMALEAGAGSALRQRVSSLLAADGPERSKVAPLAAQLVHDARGCSSHLPAAIGAFTDFYAGIEHAANGGRRRGQNPPLAPNCKYVPVAYHSRASSVRPSGTPIRRPRGQRLVGDAQVPTFGPCLKLDFELEVLLSTEAMRARGMPAKRIAVSNTRHLYWTAAQMVAHHTCGGCNLVPGDLFGSGTVSSPDPTGYGSIAELSHDGSKPFELPSGEKRTFLEDGDEVTLRARARRDGYVPIGFGECSGRIV